MLAFGLDSVIVFFLSWTVRPSASTLTACRRLPLALSLAMRFANHRRSGNQERKNCRGNLQFSRGLSALAAMRLETPDGRRNETGATRHSQNHPSHALLSFHHQCSVAIQAALSNAMGSPGPLPDHAAMTRRRIWQRWSCCSSGEDGKRRLRGPPRSSTCFAAGSARKLTGIGRACRWKKDPLRAVFLAGSSVSALSRRRLSCADLRLLERTSRWSRESWRRVHLFVRRSR